MRQEKMNSDGVDVSRIGVASTKPFAFVVPENYN
jgi:hypothetical protein